MGYVYGLSGILFPFWGLHCTIDGILHTQGIGIVDRMHIYTSSLLGFGHGFWVPSMKEAVTLEDWRGGEVDVYIAWMKNYMHYDDMSTKRSQICSVVICVK